MTDEEKAAQAEAEAKAEAEEKEADAKKKKEGKDEDVDSLKEELKKVIGQRDSAKTDKRKLKKDLDEIRSTIKDIPDKSDIETMIEELKDLKEYKTGVTEKEEEDKLKNADEFERKSLEFERQFNKLKDKMASETTALSSKVEEKEKELEQKEEHINLLRGAKLENEITKVAVKHKALNPSQVVRLLEREFSYDSDLDKFVFLERDAKGKLKDEKTVEERVEDFLSDEDNENLIEATINTEGTGTKQSETSTTTKSTQKQTDGYDPKDEALIKEADFKRLSVEDLIDTKKLRDAKFAAIEEKRKNL